MPQPESDEKDGDLDDDIEAQIRKEVEELQPKNSKAPFQAIRLEVPCGMMFSVSILKRRSE